MLLAGCKPQLSEPQSDLIMYDDYPQTINAVAVTGTVQWDGRCILFERSDGTKFTPIFRPETTLQELESLLGPLEKPVAATLSGYTPLDPLPPEIARLLAGKQCQGTPVVYGAILPGTITPPTPQM